MVEIAGGEEDRLILNYEGAIDMAEDVRENDNEEVRTVAKAINEAQTHKIDLLESLLY